MNWKDEATKMLQQYIELHPEDDFTAPEVRLWAESEGFDEPVSKQSWGGVIRAAKSAGLIKQCGFSITDHEGANTMPVRLWRAA